MPDILHWSYFRSSGFIEADDSGRPLRIFTAEGYGHEESGGYWSLDEVIFNFYGSRDRLREMADEKTYHAILDYLKPYRKLPRGLYRLTDSERSAIETGNRNGWTQIYGANDGHALLRHQNRAMAWVNADATCIVEGPDAQDLDVEYSFCFTDAEKAKLAAVLEPGADGLAAVRECLPSLSAMGKPERVTDWNPPCTVHRWQVDGRGILWLWLAANGEVIQFRTFERGAAYLYLRQ